VTDLSEERRGFLIKAVRAAETIVHMCLKSQTVRHDFDGADASIDEHFDLEMCLRTSPLLLLRGS
jgi:hypothetical protein